ncbi:MAG: class I SAM-dependent methyltransferase family protein [Candidatus Paceibacterota bacterium]
MKNNSTKIEIAKHLQSVENEKIVASASKEIKTKKFEENRFIYHMVLPFMWLLVGYVKTKKALYNFFGLGKPKINTMFFDGLGKSSRKVKEYATTWKALDIVYNHPFSHKKTIGNMIDEFYWNGLNCQGLRNRRKLIKDELRKAILKIAKTKKEIQIISLACGSAEVMIELIAEMKEKGIIVKALLIDIDEKALSRATSIAEDLRVKNQIKAERNNIYEIKNISKKFNPDIIEMMGFLDYLKYNDAIKIARIINESMSENCYFITCNISSNIEKDFLTHVIDWPMVYRTPKELLAIGVKAGFSENRVIYEPLRIHGILVSKK